MQVKVQKQGLAIGGKIDALAKNTGLYVHPAVRVGRALWDGTNSDAPNVGALGYPERPLPRIVLDAATLWLREVAVRSVSLRR